MANDSILVQVQLGAPTRANINAVTRQIQSALSNVSANVQIQNGRQATQTLQNIKSKTDAATKSTTSFADAIGLSGRRFVAFTSAVAVVGRLTSALSQATREAIKFEREFVKLAQVFDTDVRSLKGLQNSLSDVSKEFGLSATVVARTSVVLAQSGLTAKQTEQAMKTLAKTTLAATFDSIASSTEGAVAIMAQFGTEASKLESQLGAINAVSKRFAVESGDIIEAVRRAGGAFRAAGGNLNEFIALFTSVRSTTRESAETIATGFRTIFARLQRPKTIDFFRQLNIELSDGQGNFIGAFEAVRRLSAGLKQAGIQAGSLRFAEVVEQLGGIRQVSRVIPLLGEFTKAEKARQVAIAGGGSLDKDAAKAQETLAQSFARTTENFRALIRELSQTATFQAIVKIALDIANAFIEVARAIKPLLPLIAAFGAIKLGGLVSGAIRSGIGGAGGTGGLGKGFNKGGKVLGFNRGGTVPGTGNGDTVPAMLEPGEFVIRKSAVQAFGADRLAGINKYAPGGKVGKLAARKDTSKQLKNASVGTAREPFSKGLSVNSNDEFLANVIRKDIQVRKQEAANFRSKTRLNLDSLNNQAKGEAFEKYLIDKRITTLKSTTPISKNYPVDFASSGRYAEAKNVAGRISDEALIDKLWRARVQDGTYGKRKQTPTEEGNQKIDLGSITLFQIKRNYSPLREKQRKLPGFNKGGAVGTDTVPALLTPGEFVINKESAKSFGYGNLGKINKYAKGGTVSRVQRFFEGGVAEKDVVRAQGTVLTSIEEAGKVFEDVMGDVAPEIKEIILSTFKGVEEVAAGGAVSIDQKKTEFTEGTRGRAVIRGEQTGIGLQIQGEKVAATTETVAHEAGHLADVALGKTLGGKGKDGKGGKGNQLASNTEGTFQFDVIEKIKPEMQKAMKGAGYSAKQIDKYLGSNEELFAEFFAKASPEVKKILTSTTNSAKGMTKLKDHLEKAGSTYAGLEASDIDVSSKRPLQKEFGQEVGSINKKIQQEEAKFIKASRQETEVKKRLSKAGGSSAKEISNLAQAQNNAIDTIEKLEKERENLIGVLKKEKKGITKGLKTGTPSSFKKTFGPSGGGPPKPSRAAAKEKAQEKKDTKAMKTGISSGGLAVTAVALQGLAGNVTEVTKLFGVQSEALDSAIGKLLSLASVLVTINALYQTQLGGKILGGLGKRISGLAGGAGAGAGVSRKLNTPVLDLFGGAGGKAAREKAASVAAKRSAAQARTAAQIGGAKQPTNVLQLIRKQSRDRVGPLQKGKTGAQKTSGILKSVRAQGGAKTGFAAARQALAKGLASVAAKTGLGIAKAMGPQILLLGAEFGLKAAGVIKDVSVKKEEAIKRGDAEAAVDFTKSEQGQGLLNAMVIAGGALALFAAPIGLAVGAIGLLGRVAYDNAEWLDSFAGIPIGTAFVGMIDSAVNWVDGITGWATEARESAKSASLLNKAQISTAEALANFDRQIKLGKPKEALQGLESAAENVQKSFDYENRAVQGSFAGNLTDTLSFGFLGSSTEDQEKEQAEQQAKAREEEKKIAKKVIDSPALDKTVQSVIDAGGAYEDFAIKLGDENPQLFNLLSKTGELGDAFEIAKKRSLDLKFENFKSASEALLGISKAKFDRDSEIRSLTGGKTGRKEFDDFTKEQSGIINFGLNNLQGGAGGGENAFGGDVSTAKGLSALVDSAIKTKAAIDNMRSGASAFSETLGTDLNGNGQAAGITLGQAEELQRKQNLAIQQSLGLAKQRLQVIKQEIEARNANIKALNSFVTDFAFSSGKDKREKTRQFGSAQKVAAGLAEGKTVGEIQGVTQADKQASKALFEQFGDIALFGGKTGKEVLGDSRVQEFGGEEQIIAKYGKEQGEQIIHALREGTVSESDKMIKEMTKLNEAIHQAELDNVNMFNEGAKLFADSVILQASVGKQERENKKLNEEQQKIKDTELPATVARLQEAQLEAKDTLEGQKSGEKLLKQAEAGQIDYEKSQFSNIDEVREFRDFKVKQHTDQLGRVEEAEAAKVGAEGKLTAIEEQRQATQAEVDATGKKVTEGQDAIKQEEERQVAEKAAREAAKKVELSQKAARTQAARLERELAGQNATDMSSRPQLNPYGNIPGGSPDVSLAQNLGYIEQPNRQPNLPSRNVSMNQSAPESSAALGSPESVEVANKLAKAAADRLEAALIEQENIKNTPTDIKANVTGTFNLNGSENMTGEGLKEAGSQMIAMGDEKIKKANRMNETGQELPPAGTPIPLGGMA